MINKADPEVDGNTGLALPAFLALMAQAEFSGLFLDAFSLLDTEDNGWVEATALWTMMDELVPSARQRRDAGAAVGGGERLLIGLLFPDPSGISVL